MLWRYRCYENCGGSPLLIEKFSHTSANKKTGALTVQQINPIYLIECELKSFKMIYVLKIQISVFGAAFQTFKWERFHATGALLAGTTLETSSTELPRCCRIHVPPFDMTDGFGAACAWLSLFHSVDDTTYVLLQEQRSKQRLITPCCRNYNKTFALSSACNGSNISLLFKTHDYILFWHLKKLI